MADASRRLRRNARAMRHAPTRAEDRLWYWLRDRRCAGFKFKRQVPMGRYIVDFYCAEWKLVIEVDGSQHDQAWVNEYDGRRTLDLARRGIAVVRIPNELLIRDSRMVAERINAAIHERVAALGR